MLEAKFELIVPDEQQAWKMFCRPGHYSFDWHFHPEYELVVIVEGYGTRFVGDAVTRFGPGDLVLLGPDLPHTYVSDSYAVALTCQFGGDVLGTDWTSRPEFDSIARLFRRSRSGVLFAGESAERWWRMLEASPARRTAELLLRLVEIAERDDGSLLASPSFEPKVDRRATSRMGAIMRYIDDHLTEAITVDDLARVARLSPDSTGRFFRRQTGHTIPGYLNRARIAAACRLLAGSEMAVSQVAFASGYANLANFHRQFRRITAMTPAAFRAQHRSSAGASAASVGS